jgi:hypothetical protein
MTVVNLNKARKAKAKLQAREQAAANRVQFGRTKSEKSLTEAEKRLADRRLDDHRRDSDD